MNFQIIWYRNILLYFFLSSHVPFVENYFSKLKEVLEILLETILSETNKHIKNS